MRPATFAIALRAPAHQMIYVYFSYVGDQPLVAVRGYAEAEFSLNVN